MASASGFLAGFGVRITPRRREFQVHFLDGEKVVRIDQEPPLLPLVTKTGSVRYTVGHDQLTNEAPGDPAPQTYARFERDPDHALPTWRVGTQRWSFAVPGGYTVNVKKPTRAEPWEVALRAAPLHAARLLHMWETGRERDESVWAPGVDHEAWIRVDSIGSEVRAARGGYVDEDGALVREVRHIAERGGRPVELRRISVLLANDTEAPLAAIAEGLEEFADRLHNDAVALVRSIAR